MLKKMRLQAEKRKLKRVRGKLFGKSTRPRLSVFRSNKKIYAQIIDDEKGITLVSASDSGLPDNLTKTQKATKVGEELAEKARKIRLKKIVFDRGKFAYHGRVKALAEGVREKGVSF